MVISSSVDGADFLVATTRSTWRCLITKRLFKTQNLPYFNIYMQESQIANLSGNFNKIQSGTVWNTLWTDRIKGDIFCLERLHFRVGKSLLPRVFEEKCRGNKPGNKGLLNRRRYRSCGPFPKASETFRARNQIFKSHQNLQNRRAGPRWQTRSYCFVNRQFYLKLLQVGQSRTQIFCWRSQRRVRRQEIWIRDFKSRRASLA